MKKTIEMHGDNSSVLSITLKNILDCIEHGEQYSWMLLWLEASGDLGEESIVDFEKKVNHSDIGYSISWSSLMELSNSFFQVIELLLIGDQDASRLKRYSNDEEMHFHCAFSIELVDSSYWIVHSDNIVSIDRMIKNLPGAKLLGTDGGYL